MYNEVTKDLKKENINIMHITAVKFAIIAINILE